MTPTRLMPVLHIVGPLVAFVAIIVFWSTPPNLLGVLFLTLVLIVAWLQRSTTLMSSLHT